MTKGSYVRSLTTCASAIRGWRAIRARRSLGDERLHLFDARSNDGELLLQLAQLLLRFFYDRRGGFVDERGRVDATSQPIDFLLHLCLLLREAGDFFNRIRETRERQVHLQAFVDDDLNEILRRARDFGGWRARDGRLLGV